MPKTFRTYLLLLCALTSVTAAAQKTGRIDKNLSIYTDVMRQVDMFYVDTLDYDNMTETAINQMLQRIDPYTVYYSKKKDDELRMMTTGKYGGIGSIIQLHPGKDAKGRPDTTVVIANPYEGKPAQKAGLMAGDVILEVDGWDTKGQSVSDVSNHLRGVPGTTVKLQIHREGVEKPFRVEFAREEIHLDPIEYACVIDSVAYIGFSEFTEGSADAFQTTLYHLVEEGAQSLVLDLRGNGGGLVDEAVSMLSNFVPQGTEVVSMRGKATANSRSYSTSAPPLYPELPIAVLVNKNSASASEIVAGALQDLKRATLLGERTFGKGLVQNIRAIAYGGHLKVTTAKYYLPSGRCIQAIDYADRQRGKQLHRDTAGGILPDILLTDSQKLDISYELYTRNHFFDYANRYRRTHDSIARPEMFNLTDSEIEDFCDWLEAQNFTYTTETARFYSEMLDMARHEDLDSTTLAALEALEPQLKPDFRAAIRRNSEGIREMLGAEIVQRYYYQKGRIAYMLRYDKELQRAIEEVKKTKKERQ